ncbi:hypothetical protein D3C81_1443850 [compost metagenome]
MIMGIGGDFRLQFGSGAGRGRGGQRQLGAHALHHGIGRVGGGHGDGLARLFGVALGQIDAGHAGDGLGVVRLHGQDMGEGLGRAAEVVERQGFLAQRQQLLDVGVDAGAAGQLVDEGLDLAVGNGALEAVDRLAVDEGVDGRDRLDPQLARIGRVGVDVDLDHLDRALRPAHGLFQGGPEGPARAAPGGPEVDDDRLMFRGLDHVGHEGGVRAVLDQVVGKLGVGEGHDRVRIRVEES